MVKINKYKTLQEDEKDCGAACLASIIKYYNGYVPLEIIKGDTLTDYNGTNFYNIKVASNKYGFNSVGYYKELVDPPYIVQTKINNYYHFMVVYKITNKYTLVMDPAKGIVKYSNYDFNNIFTGNILKLTPIGNIVKYDKKNIYKVFLKKLLISNFKYLLICLILSILIIIFNLLETYLIKEVLISKKLFLLFIIVIFLKLIFKYLNNRQLININKIININLLNNYLFKYFNLPYKYLYLKSSGDIINRVKDLNKVKDYLTTEIINIIINLGTLIITTIILFKINYKITLIILIIYLITYIIYNKFIKKILNNYNDIININNDYIDNINEYITKILTISSLNINKYFINKLEVKSMNISENNYKQDNIFINLNTLLEFINIICILLIVGVLFNYDFNYILIYMLYYNILKDSVNYFITINSSLVYLKSILDRINSVYYLKDINKYKGIKFVNNDIIIKNISYSYGINKVLDNVSYKIIKGNKVLIKGYNGSGKSTIINILTKNITDYIGNIYIGNLNLKKISYNSYLNNISYVNQDSSLFEDTILNNIILNNKFDYNKLNMIIELLNLDNILAKKENKLNTIIKDNFSGGEKQKIIIARCLYKESKIIMFDEAFSEISSKERIDIINRINNVYKDKTIIYVNHFDDNIKYDQILKLDNYRKDKEDE